MPETILWRQACRELLLKIRKATKREVREIEGQVNRLLAAARTSLTLRTITIGYETGSLGEHKKNFEHLYNVPELRELVFEGMTATALCAFERTSRSHRSHAADYQRRKLGRLLGIFDVDADALLSILRENQAIAVGSIAHLAAIAENEWFPVTDLDIATTPANETHVADTINTLMGYSTAPESAYPQRAGLYPVQDSVTLWKEVGSTIRTIKITSVRCQRQGGATEAFANALSTAGFNAITGYGIFIGYPEMMDSKTAIRNDTDHLLLPEEGALTALPRKALIDAHVAAYAERGLRFLQEKHENHLPQECNKSPSCPLTVRTMTDKGSAFVRVHLDVEMMIINRGEGLGSLRLPSVSWRLANIVTGDDGHGTCHGGQFGEDLGTVEDTEDEEEDDSEEE